MLLRNHYYYFYNAFFQDHVISQVIPFPSPIHKYVIAHRQLYNKRRKVERRVIDKILKSIQK